MSALGILYFAPIRRPLQDLSAAPHRTATIALPPVAEAKKIDAQQSLSPAEQNSLRVLHEILQSKNDNDPRIDKDLKSMSPKLHAELVNVYETLPAEKRNQRGLIAFLIARDLKSSEDVNFLKSIFTEPPCMSTVDCSQRGSGDPHLSSVEQTTANYPQLATLYQLERQLSSNISQDMKSQIHDLLQTASRFPVPVVQQKAEALIESMSL